MALTGPTSALPDERTLRKKLRELKLLTRSSHALNSTLDLDKLLNVIVKIVKDALSVETVSVLLFDSEQKNMVFELARGARGKETRGLKIPVTEGVVGWVARHKRPAIVNDLMKDPRYSPILEKKFGMRTRSIMSIPLRRRGRMIGVLEAVNRINDEPFTKDDLQIFLALGDHIAAALENARLYREAERSRFESRQLYEIGVGLGKAVTLDEALQQMLKSLAELVSFDAAAIFVLDRKNQELVSHLQQGYDANKLTRLRLKLDQGIVGWAARHKKGVIAPDTSRDRRYVEARRRTRSEMVAPMLSRGRVIGLFNLESDRVNAYSESDLVLLETFAAQAGVSIERAQLYQEQSAKRQLERELRLARTVQQFFTPRRSRKLGGYTLTGRNYPSLELSGDYVDVFPLRKPFSAFAIADVAGKGVPASIIMSSFRATLHTVATECTRARDIAVRANQILLETVRPQDFVTAFIAVLNRESGEITYCNAGHEPPILMHHNGRYRLLEAGGTVLGVTEHNPLEEGSLELGDNLLFCYTDGATEAENRREEPFGLRRLVRFVRANRHLSTVRLCISIRNHLLEYIEGGDQADDWTFLALKK